MNNVNLSETKRKMDDASSANSEWGTTSQGQSNYHQPVVSTANKSERADSSGVEAGKEWTCVGHESKFGIRTPLRVHGRQVTILRLKGRGRRPDGERDERWTCMDSICYHAGAPLMQGKLERVDGRTCVSCPSHRYLVDVFTGEGLYKDKSRKYRSKGVRQRVHAVRLDAESKHVYVKLNGEGEVASDEYAFKGRNFWNGAEVETQCFPDW